MSILVFPNGLRRKRRPALRLRLNPTSHRHFHYCEACDRQWPHPGEGPACVRHWAWRCPGCQPDQGESVYRRSA
ncbi:MAG TPA: hypothetical protein VGW35_23985 [Methylomirabilota bacterium]|nr:hypothetical protein [Methylomirabilota bacterium]